MTDQEFLAEIKRANTPKKILAIIVENENLFGHDPYYAEFRRAMLKQAQKILGTSVGGRGEG